MAGPRSIGYRWFGRGFDYLLHLRPAQWPALALHVLTGAVVAAGLPAIAAAPIRGDLLAGMLAFVVGLNGGTLAVNSAFDRDRGDITYLARPPAPPRGLAGFGLILMIAGLAVALTLPGKFLLAYGVCAALSLAYSVPPVRLKAVAGMDWLVNFLGFGFLTPYAGWALAGAGLSTRGLLLLGSFAALYGGLYPLTQLYQREEDRSRGDRTTAVALGVTGTFTLSLTTMGVASLGFLIAGLRAPPLSGAGGAALGVAAASWFMVLLPWWRSREVLAPAGHQGFMKRSFIAWAVTDLAVIWAFAP